jgi:hypothetical protein
MKILSIGTHLFSSTWRELGHTVCVITDYDRPPHSDNRKIDFFAHPRECEAAIRSIIESFGPDVVFQGDCSKPIIHWGVENYSIPKVWYAIDTHLHHDWHKHYAAAFDTVFLAQKNMLPVVRAYAERVEWLPAFCQCSPDFVPWSERSTPVSFVGTMDAARNPGRVAFFEALAKNNVRVQISTGDYIPIYSTSMVVVNQSVADDLNLRFFEATGCGAALVTDRLSWPVDDILEEDVDFLAYEHGNALDCADKIRWALTHAEEAGAMATRAHAKIRTGHMVYHRARRVLEEFERLVGCRPFPERGPDRRLAQVAWTHYVCSQLSIQLPLTVYFAERGEQLAARCRGSQQWRPWSLLISAAAALDKGNTGLSNALLMQVPEPPDDNDLRTTYYSLHIKLCSLEGHFDGAFEFLERAKWELPEVKVFDELEEILRSRRPASGEKAD